MLLKVVLDTNVVVSAHLNPDGLERIVLNLALSSSVVLFVTTDILNEYRTVLERKKFGLDARLVKESLEILKATAVNIFPRASVSISPDPDDNKFLECAQTAGADYLVTGNKRHFPSRWKETHVVSSREFVELITQELFSGD